MVVAMLVLLTMILTLAVAVLVRMWVLYMYVSVIKANNPELYSKVKGDLDSSFDHAPGVYRKHWRANNRFYTLVIKNEEHTGIPKLALAAFKLSHLIELYLGVIFIISFFGFIFFQVYNSPLFK